MRRQLEETLIREEAYQLYSKIDSAEMFGYEMSSGFGSGRSTFFPTSTGFGVTVKLPKLPGIRDYHETFKIDRYDNIYGGHSSVTGSDKKKKRFDW